METAYCSFCGKSQSQVRRLVSSPTNTCFICDACVEICKEIVVEAEHKVSRNTKFALPTPVEIKKSLDEYIVGQDNAKRAMAVAVYNHYKRLNYNLSLKSKTIELDKSNILLIGPTGVGKTLIAKTLAKILKVPFACVDATSLTEAGYVGDDVESILSKLLINADYDVKRAEMGIIYIDEIDKIARKIDTRNMTRDVSGEGVQQALLKILEGTTAQVSVNSGRKSPHQDTVSINTSNILFICGGAFVKLPEIIKNRSKTSNLGFNQEENTQNSYDLRFTPQMRVDDLVAFGLIPEFVGRLPVVVSLDPLDKSAMLNILTTPKNNLIDQYKTFFSLDGITLEFEKTALDKIAEQALDLGMGARGLRTILEETMLDTMFSSPSEQNLQTVIINKECVSKNTQPKRKFKSEKNPKKSAKNTA
ncbi:MAG: ATP-dependent Clp protease ATP-binding subunit ClpX [Clostridia bacterium]|nr:ATP-dependent Clp protease ATP-binding subunit ClpX [Clostridia bacterium]